MRQRPQGVTLIELLVTLSVVGLLLLASLPSMSAWMRNSQIRSTAESLQSGLAKARSEALRRNTNVRFSLVSSTTSSTCTLTSSAANWIVSLQNPAGLCDVAAGDTNAPVPLEKWAQTETSSNVTLAVRTVVNGVCSGVTATNTDVVFNGFGRVATGTTPIRCIVLDHSGGSGNRVLNILIGTGGTVRSCDPAVTDTTDPRSC